MAEKNWDGFNMREILFRGKRTDTNEWIEGSYIKSVVRNSVYGYITPSYPTEPTKIYTPTLGQFTGMCDKNYNKIFEGDIIKFGICQRLMYVHWNGESLAWEITDVGVSDCEVNHLLNTFELAEIQVEAAYGEMVSEVVGNIHDNPELSKGGANNG